MTTVVIEIHDGTISIKQCPEDFQLIVIDHDWENGPVTSTLSSEVRQ